MTQSLDKPRMRTRMGDRAFSVAGPRTWNTLPADICCAHSLRFFGRYPAMGISPFPLESLDTFKKHLKSHLFFAAYEL